MNIDLELTWEGGKQGTGIIKGDNLTAEISIPTVYGGLGTGSNPKELYVASTAACFISTLTAMIDGKKLPIISLSVVTNAKTNDDEFSIIHQANIILDSEASSVTLDKAQSLVAQADKICLIGNLARKAGINVSAIANVTQAQ
ncbi:OsmC family protein [Acinetobacter sp. MB5]|uniref:OsmC family protein n=1 Tax=Acinetobacter sp. MB5 TaxID=2069438 RepID=UPI000DD0468A|nr:OsmC family protein [Acinetobacter sp. MB5]